MVWVRGGRVNKAGLGYRLFTGEQYPTDISKVINMNQHIPIIIKLQFIYDPNK